METNGARRLLDLLIDHGIDTVTGIPGGSILPLYDALHSSPIRHVLARHEQGAAFIAQGIARASGKLGVCLATSGPGATNLLTGLADAWRDSIPLLAITGQVPRAHIGTQAFQEIDIASLARPCCKAVWEIRTAGELDHIVPEAIHCALSGRPGPVLLDIPKDVFLESCAAGSLPSALPTARRQASSLELRTASKLLAASNRPVFYVGGGIHSADAGKALRNFATTRGIPVASTLLGLGALPFDHPLHLGMIGMHGVPAANLALQECDLLIVAGARFDDRATGCLASFAPQAQVIHLDADPAEFGRQRNANATLHGDALAVLEAWHLLDRYEARASWLTRIAALRRNHPLPPSPMHTLMRRVAEAAPDSIATTDVGQHQMWAAQAWPVREGRTFLTSGGLGTMGFGLPAAIGASLASPGRTVICLSGDGSILMNLQELATLADLDLPVKICVFDNAGLGMVRQQQDLFFGERHSACRFETRPDLAAIAQGFGIPALRVDEPMLEDGWRALLSSKGPALLVFKTDPQARVWPVVPAGKANHEMRLPSSTERIPMLGT
ncbi:MAG: hypothetical protein RL318_2243 [Fibrobacterota bacterium]|jgi:acetolactate synthase-1/2/3 large subunit